ncbi:hypothetical protein [Paenibacillus terrae]|uniref:Uncharacterized protein n=1 Tax=Paenibacillus terrae TaxID=159743 RepID=A0A0D7X1C0_9BACL|nr:hypothetical protein [Paenibacillus terrae]KJD43782.1 hypothetical protein QD47_20795 [Paenibacillus terrae]
MFDGLIVLLMLFIVLVYLVNSRSIKDAAIHMIQSGEMIVKDPDKEIHNLQTQSRWCTKGMVSIGIIILIVGVVVIRDFVIILFH